jgi:hypothetical protein
LTTESPWLRWALDSETPHGPLFQERERKRRFLEAEGERAAGGDTAGEDADTAHLTVVSGALIL